MPGVGWFLAASLLASALSCGRTSPGRKPSGTGGTAASDAAAADTPLPGPFCGDGIVNGGEECDNGRNDDGYGALRGCAPGCVLPPRCGDGIVQAAYGEICDRGSENSNSTDPNLAYRTCTANCRYGGYCGDGVVNGPEQCDDGINDGTSHCDPDCTIARWCGDGIVQPEYGEACEPTGPDDPNCNSVCQKPETWVDWPPVVDASAIDSSHGAVDLQGSGALDASRGIDACQPLTCGNSPCGRSYCGRIGDGCGGTLDCGNPCSSTETCTLGQCLRNVASCVPLTCDLWGSYHYCGTIGDGCADNLECGCPSGWTCENHFCIGRPPVCTPKTCAEVAKSGLCGKLDDGCGGTLDCPTCPTPGWLCGGGGTCYAPPPFCSPMSSCFWPSGDVYCGTIGDGCGGTLLCGDTCSPLGRTCENNMCGNAASRPPVAPLPPGPYSGPPPPPPPACRPPWPPTE